MENETVISKMQMYVQKIFAYVEGIKDAWETL